MKSILILVACFYSAYAGVGVVTPQIEAEALRLWQRYCGGAGGEDGAAVGIHCKIAQAQPPQIINHRVELSTARTPAQQVVFVQPPSYHYEHEVTVTGEGASAPKTVIYVKPAQNTNRVNIKDETRPGKGPSKPSLYFLKGNHGNQQNTRTDSDVVHTQPSLSYNSSPPLGYL